MNGVRISSLATNQAIMWDSMKDEGFVLLRRLNGELYLLLMIKKYIFMSNASTLNVLAVKRIVKAEGIMEIDVAKF